MSEAGQCGAPAAPLPLPAMGPLPGEGPVEAVWAELRDYPPPHWGLHRVQVQGFRAGPSLSCAWGDRSLLLIPAAVRLEFGV